MRDQVLAALRGGGGDPEALAIQLFHAQRRASPLIAAMTLQADGGEPDPQGWEEIPAIPVGLFKELELMSFHAAPGRRFLTSGTTGAVRGVHAMLDTLIYDAASWAHFCARGGVVPGPVLSLCPPPTSDSSLGHMIGHFAASSGQPLVQLFDSDSGVSGQAMPMICVMAPIDGSAGHGPCFLASTAFSLDAMLDGTPDLRANLGPDSVVMVTGGFKGRRVRLDSEALYRSIPVRLGSPAVVGEYGMTELSSQLWTDPVAAGKIPGAFIAPPWLHVYTVNPASGAPDAAGGLLRFVDLANTDSVVAIETMDLGRVEYAADGARVWLEGRLAGAELRGCSLRAEDFRAAGAHQDSVKPSTGIADRSRGS